MEHGDDILGEGGEIQGRTAELAPSSGRDEEEERGKIYEEEEEDEEEGEIVEQKTKRSCQPLNGALAWKHLQHMQVEQICHPCAGKMKKTTVNLSQLGAVSRYLCHTQHRG